uniref:Uncharacterized protein n=1 Tax=Ixodes ricinus TaxID=34613 RepID=A0A6B0UB94_IXORI
MTSVLYLMPHFSFEFATGCLLLLFVIYVGNAPKLSHWFGACSLGSTANLVFGLRFITLSAGPLDGDSAALWMFVLFLTELVTKSLCQGQRGSQSLCGNAIRPRE